MLRDQLVQQVSKRLNDADRESDLINFVDDTVDWDRIAEIAILNIFSQIVHQFTPVKDTDELCICGRAWNTSYHNQ